MSRAFDHSEWISRMGSLKDSLVVTSLTNSDGAHTKIALVNINGNSITNLIEGDDLWHPCLWANATPSSDKNIDLDSAGLYFDGSVSNPFIATFVEQAIKMSKFWAIYEDVEYLSFGSSMTNNAIYDDSISTYKSLNMAVTLADLHSFLYVIRNYALPYAKKLKVISIELAPGLLFRSKEFLWELTRNASPGFLYDENNLKDNVKSIAKIATEREYPQDLLNLNYLENTFLLPSLSWEKAETPVDVSTMPFDDANLQNNLKELIALKSLAEKNGIAFFMTITPRNKDYKKIDSYGYFGPSWNVATEIIEKIKKLGNSGL